MITSENILDLFNSQIFVAIDIKTIERGSEHCIVLLSLRSYHGSLELIIRDASIEIGIKLSENALHLLNSHLVFEDFFSDCLKGFGQTISSETCVSGLCCSLTVVANLFVRSNVVEDCFFYLCVCVLSVPVCTDSYTDCTDCEGYGSTDSDCCNA